MQSKAGRTKIRVLIKNILHDPRSAFALIVRMCVKVENMGDMEVTLLDEVRWFHVFPRCITNPSQKVYAWSVILHGSHLPRLRDGTKLRVKSVQLQLCALRKKLRHAYPTAPAKRQKRSPIDDRTWSETSSASSSASSSSTDGANIRSLCGRAITRCILSTSNSSDEMSMEPVIQVEP